MSRLRPRCDCFVTLFRTTSFEKKLTQDQNKENKIFQFPDIVLEICFVLGIK